MQPMKIPDPFALAWFVAFSVVTFLAFGYDKWRASRAGWRVPEMSLVLLGALGGWLGGLIGMQIFRHKTAKWTFWLKYALGLPFFAAELWLWWRSRELSTFNHGWTRSHTDKAEKKSIGPIEG